MSLALLFALLHILVSHVNGDCYPTYASRLCSNGVTLTAPAGNLSSNSDDGLYVKNLDCTFLISAPVGQFVTLTIDTISTECGYDFVFVHDGDKTRSPLIASLSGEHTSSTLPKFYSTGNNMMVEFVSDRNLEEYGFRAHYTFDPCPGGCTGRGTCVAGVCQCNTGMDGVACEHEALAVTPAAEKNPCWVISTQQTNCYCNTSLNLDYQLFTVAMGTYTSSDQTSPAPQWLMRCPSRPTGSTPCRFCPRPYANQMLYVAQQCPDPSLACAPACSYDESCWTLLKCCYCPTCDDSSTSKLAGARLFVGIFAAVAGCVILNFAIMIVLLYRRRARARTAAMMVDDAGNPPMFIPPRRVKTIFVVDAVPEDGKVAESVVYRPIELPGVLLRCAVIGFPNEDGTVDETSLALGSVLEVDDEHGERVPEPTEEPHMDGTGEDTADEHGIPLAPLTSHLRQREVAEPNVALAAPPPSLFLPQSVAESETASAVTSARADAQPLSDRTTTRTDASLSPRTTPRVLPRAGGSEVSLSPLRLDLETIVRSSDEIPSSRDRSGNVVTSGRTSARKSVRRAGSMGPPEAGALCPPDEEQEVFAGTPRTQNTGRRSARPCPLGRSSSKEGVRVNNFLQSGNGE